MLRSPLHFLVFLLIPFIIVLVVMLTKGVRKWYAYVSLAAVLLIVTLLISFTFPSSKELRLRERLLFSSSAQDMKTATVSPVYDDHRSPANLVQQPVVISDKEMIGRILDALKTSRSHSPNHPGDGWECLLSLHSEAGQVTVQVHNTHTQENGVIVTAWSGKRYGYVLGVFRCDALANVIESVVDDAEAD